MHSLAFAYLVKKNYPEKRSALAGNTLRKVGTENTFFTLFDLANITINKADSTKSLASSYFQDSQQKYFDNIKRKAFNYEDLTPSKLASAMK